MPETLQPYDADADEVAAGQPRAARIERCVAGFRRLMLTLAVTHAPDLLEIQLTMSQAKVLYVVQVAGSIRMSVLAARLGVALSTISGVVDRLVDMGFVDRHDDPGDRRQVVVSVTATGAAEVERLHELNTADLQVLLSRVADDDLDVLMHAVEVLVAASARSTSVNGIQPPNPETSRAPHAGGTAS